MLSWLKQPDAEKKTFLFYNLTGLKITGVHLSSASTVAGPRKAPLDLGREYFEGANMGKIF